MNSLTANPTLWESLTQDENRNFESRIENFVDQLCSLLEISRSGNEAGDHIHLTYFDMSSIQLKVTGKTPFFFVEIKTTDKHWINDFFLKIKTKIFELNLQEQVVFIVVVGGIEYLTLLCRDSLLDIVVLNETTISSIEIAEKPRNTFVKICKEQINVRQLSPYETIDPVIGPMFYGRRNELKTLLTQTDKNFVVTGCRKIGKSSLILNAYHRMKKDVSTYPLFIDCYAYKEVEEFVNQVVTRLEIRELRRMRIDKFHNFLRRMSRKYGKRITFIMDEVDELLGKDELYGGILFKQFSAAHSEGYCRIIITGFRNVFKISRNLSSPIYRFLHPIAINELDHESAVALITQPIRDMGIILENSRQIVDEILLLTASQPNLIQFLCKLLVEIESKRKSNRITIEDLKEVEKSSQFRHYVTDTFILNSTPLEELTVYCMVGRPTFTQEDIKMELEKHGIRMTIKDIETLCLMLEMANVFYRKGRSYYFAFPALPRILIEDFDVTFMIKNLSAEVK